MGLHSTAVGDHAGIAGDARFLHHRMALGFGGIDPPHAGRWLGSDADQAVGSNPGASKGERLRYRFGFYH